MFFTGIPITGQRFVYGGKPLQNDDMLLTDYGVRKESTIFMHLRFFALNPTNKSA